MDDLKKVLILGTPEGQKLVTYRINQCILNRMAKFTETMGLDHHYCDAMGDPPDELMNTDDLREFWEELKTMEILSNEDI